MGHRMLEQSPLVTATAPRRSIARERVRQRPGLIQRMMPLPWALWPAEARLLVGLAAFWSLAGLLVLGSASSVSYTHLTLPTICSV